MPSERLQYTESFDDYAQYGEALVTATLEERDGKTTLTNFIVSPSRDVRDAVIRSGMEHGAAETYDRLAAVLASAGETKSGGPRPTMTHE